jgi:nicotinamide-nucleotide amidase
MTSKYTERSADELAVELGNLLLSINYRLTAAESCTGGLLAACLTDVPGASNWFDQSWVTYSNQAKTTLVGVAPQTLEQYGAVSEQTVQEMASGARRRASADVGIAISGIAGPDGGTDEKPVGTVWIAWSLSDQNVDSRCFAFTGNRQQVREAALLEALIGTIMRVSNNTG